MEAALGSRALLRGAPEKTLESAVVKKNKAAKAQKALPQTIKGGEAAAPDEPITALGWRVIAAGAASVVAGFFVLTKADPMGRNWASTMSPLLTLGGYALVGLGIFASPAPEGGETPPSAPPPAGS